MAAFYPSRNFAFGATEYVAITYNGEELANTTFTIKALPTFIQGFVADQFGEPIEGLTVAIPDLQRTAVSDANGSFSFVFGDTAAEAIAAGRYKVVANPGLANRRYATTEFWATAESGRLNQLGLNTVPILDQQEPFRHIASGDAQAILAAGDLTLNLGSATLEFAGGASAGDVHAQFLPVTEQPYAYVSSAAPQWVFHLNPNDIKVRGSVGVRLKMPAMLGSYDYVSQVGERVVLVGLDANSLKIVPVGVGKVDTTTRTVASEGPTSFQRLDLKVAKIYALKYKHVYISF